MAIKGQCSLDCLPLSLLVCAEYVGYQTTVNADIVNNNTKRSIDVDAFEKT